MILFLVLLNVKLNSVIIIVFFTINTSIHSYFYDSALTLVNKIHDAQNVFVIY